MRFARAGHRDVPWNRPLLQGKSNEIEQLGKNAAALIRIADPPFSEIGSNGPVQTVGMVFHLRLRRFVWRWTSG
jgi:hypothetical protein